MKTLPITRKSARLAAALALLATGSPGLSAEGAVEEILVVGQGVGSLRLNDLNGAGGRLGLSAFETPASVDMITREEILAKGDYGANAAITRSAGISTTANPGNGGTSVSARGFNGHNSTINTYDGTRLYIVAGTVTFPADTWTLDRVEVLRGAGSVINGMGAVGTTINYVPKAPVLGERDFDVLVAGGSFGMKRVAAGAGAQIADHWALRLDVAHQKEGGFVDRNDQERNVITGSVLFQPSENFSTRLSVDFGQNSASNHFGTPLIDSETTKDLRRNNYNFANGRAVHEDLWTRFKTEWKLAPNVTFRNDTYYLNVRREWLNVEEYAFNPDTNLIDRAFFLGITHDEEQAGTRGDFLIESDWGAVRNKFTIGAEGNFIQLDYFDNFFTGGFGFADSVPVFDFNPGNVPTEIPIVADYSTDTEQSAVFFDDVAQLTDSLSFVFGGRYDNLDFRRFNHPIAGVRDSSEFDGDFSEFTWRLGAVYRPLDTLSLYAQYSTAADPVTSPVSISASNKDFDLSEGRQLEIGVKHQIFNGHAEYTLAWFDIEKEDLLTRRPGSAITEQIGQQSSSGVELTFRATPLDSLSIDLNAVWLDAEFDEFFSGGLSLEGNTPRNVPETTANLWVNWTPVNGFQIGAGLRYVDSRFSDNENTQKIPSYTVLDAMLNWNVTENTMVILRGRNLTDKAYVQSQYTTDQWIFGDPRSFELSVRFAM